MPEVPLTLEEQLRTAQHTIDEQQATIERLRLERHEPVAIVGIGLRFPGNCRTPVEFSEFLRAGRSGICPVPGERWDVAAFAADGPDDARGRMTMARAGFVDQIDQFDPLFFNISPNEARYVDPQQRLLLETAWEAFEHANIDPTPLRRGNGGVYIGASSIDYAFETEALPYDELDGHLATGLTLFPLAGRLSYFFGWHGPSICVDTACASSLTALHLAVGGLRAGECDIALCGAVNLIHHPRVPVIFTQARMLSPDSECRTFDEYANGYVRSEGCGVLVLKRLSDAVRDDDKIVAVVRGTAVRQDGDSAGLTVPNGTAQEGVMRAALVAATLSPADIQYVEAHGTGTPLGDPIEMGSISNVFRESHSRANPVVVGSVKTNLGHMEPVAGIGGIVKTVLQMRARTIFPHLNFCQPSGRIPWDSCPVTVPTQCRRWEAPIRRAIVNSFGVAGTICAAVVEEPPAVDRAGNGAPAARTGGVFTLSAKSRPSLLRQAERYRSYLSEHPELDVADICYTSNVGRAHFSHRLAAPVRDRDDLATLLDRLLARGEQQRKRPHEARKVAFLFPGQGSQFAGMGTSLYRDFPVFRRHVDECDERFAPHLGRSVKELMSGGAGSPHDLDSTRFTQPALFTLEYALAKLWLSWGVRPNVMIGHSIGEVVAAAVAGVFPLEDAVALVAARGRLMHQVRTPGGMAAVGAAVEEVQPLLADCDDIAIAAVNSPRQCVISGERDRLGAVASTLRDRGWPVRALAVSHAFHSPLMAEVSDDFRAVLKDVEFHEPTTTLISNITGAVADPEEIATADYWVRHIGAPVQFRAGMVAVERRGRHVCIEIGPGSALTSLAKQCVSAADHTWVTCLHSSDQDGGAVLAAAAQVYSAGLPISWRDLHAGREVRKVPLPSYSFDRRRYWLPVDEGRHSLSLRHLGGRPGTEGTAVTGAADTGAADTGAGGGRDRVPARPGSGLCYEPAWQRRPRPQPPTGSPRRVLAVNCPDAAAAAMVRPAIDAGVMVTRAADRDAAGGTVRAGDVTDVAWFWRSREVAPSTSALREECEDNYRDLLDLLRTLRQEGFGHPQRLWLVTERAQWLPDDGAGAGAHLAAATLWGFGQVLLEEQPDFQVTMVDLPADGTGLADLVAEWRGPEAGEFQVAFRGGARYVRRLLPYPDAGAPDGAVEVPTGPEPGAAGPPETTVPLGDQVLVRVHAAGLSGGCAGTVAATGPNARCQVGDEVVVYHSGGGPSPLVTVPSAAAVPKPAGWSHPAAAAVACAYVPAYHALHHRAGVKAGDRVVVPDADSGFGQAAAALAYRAGATVTVAGPGEHAGIVLAGDPVGDPRPDDADHAILRTVTELVAAGQLPTIPAVEFPLAEAGHAAAVAARGGVGGQVVLRCGDGDSTGTRETRIDPDATYLITGGLGALGLATGEKLVELGARHLVLAGRRPAAAAADPARLDRLVSRAEVTLFQGDIADEQDVARLIDRLRTGPQPLKGIIHAAGLPDDTPIASQTWENLDALFRAKVYGSWLLHELAQALGELDFVVGYSSAASVVGGATQSSQAAANAFLDGLMWWRARQGLPGLAVCWGPWSEIGMSAALGPQQVQALAATGVRLLPPHRALPAVMALLDGPRPQIAVGDCDWDRFVATRPVPNQLYEQLGGDRGLPAGGAPEAGVVSGNGQRGSVDEIVRAGVAKVLRIEDPETIESDVELLRLGLDSLMAMELKNSLEAALRLPLPATIAFEYPSVGQLVEFLDRRIKKGS